MALAVATVPAGCHRHRLALAVGARDHTLGRQGAFPAADPVPRPEPRQGRIAVLGALRVQRPSADRRPAVDDLLAAVPGAGAHRWRAQPVGRRCHRARHGGPRRRGLDAVLPRSGLALGRRADRGAGLQLRGVDGLAHPAHRPGAEPRLPADCPRLPRPGAGAQLDPLRRCGRGRRRRHRAGARPGGAAGDLSAGGLRPLAHLVCAAAARRPAGELAAVGRRCGVRAGDRCRAGHADGRAGPGVEPRLDRLCRGGARLAASGPAADPGDARRVRRRGPHGGLLGAAELRLARYGPLHRPEHGPALHRRDPAPAAADGRRARPAVGAGDPLLRLRCGRGVALCARLVHAGLPRPFRAVARGQPLPPAGGRDVSDRGPDRNSGWVWRASAVPRSTPRFCAQAGDHRRRDAGGGIRAWQLRLGSGSAECRGCLCR